MSANGLILIVLDNEIKLAQKSLKNSAPSYEGMAIINFFRHKARRDFIVRLNACKMHNLEKFAQICQDLGISEQDVLDSEHGPANRALEKTHPSFSPWMGSGIFEYIQDSSMGVPILNSYNFAADSLRCEWAYVLDFDKGTFEIYTGLNMDPLTTDERFYNLEPIANTLKTAGTYHPIKLSYSFDLDKLPSKEQFLAKVEAGAYQDM